MGVDVVLEREGGSRVEEVPDPHNLLSRLLPPDEDESFQLLRFIDPYGNTVFNRLQMPVFLTEWERLLGIAQTPQQNELLLKVKAMGQQCATEHHLYLKFYGD